MLWVWPETGADALLESALKQPCVFSEAMDPAWGGAGGDYMYFKSTANWSLMLENALDPSHAASLHEPALGRRTDMVLILDPLVVSLLVSLASTMRGC